MVGVAVGGGRVVGAVVGGGVVGREVGGKVIEYSFSYYTT